MPGEITADEFRRTLGLFATGVTVVTTTDGDVLHGMTVSAFASVSLDPMLVLVCVDRQAGLHDLLLRVGVFAVTVLADDQERESAWFASPRRPHGRDQFDAVDWEPAPGTGCPVLAAGIGFVDCRTTDVHAGGDHSIVVGEVVALGQLRDRPPLLYQRGRYGRLASPR